MMAHMEAILVDLSRIAAARARLTAVTPMKTDCGRLCGAACCQPDEDGMGGMYLFPGEENLIEAAAWARVEEEPNGPGEAGAKLLSCAGQCDREKRPLACMLFPLSPFFDGAGRVDVRLDARARPICPLACGRRSGLSDAFVTAARAAMALIAEDEEGAAFLADWQRIEAQYRNYRL